MNLLESNYRRGHEAGELEAPGEDNQRYQYHKCVKEIKEEGQILGSLALHHEAMRRLKEKEGPQATHETSRRQRTDPARLRSVFTSIRHNTSNLAKSFRDISQMVNGDQSRSNSTGSTNPAKSIIIGRRISNAATGFDQSVLAAHAQIRRDLELSDDSDWEDEEGSGMPHPPYVDYDEGSSPPPRKRSSLFRRGSSMFHDDEEKRSVGPRRRPSVVKRTGSRIKRGSRRRYSSRRSSITSASTGDGGSKALAPDEIKSNGVEGTSPRSGDHITGDEWVETEGDLGDHGKTLASSDGKKYSKERATTANGGRRTRRTGRRRSSLFSVNEEGASITNSFGRSSDTSLSLSGSLTGSFSARETLICNFRHRNSSFALGASDSEGAGDLICDWGPRTSDLTDAGGLSIQEELLTEGREEKGTPRDSNGSLICGWDRSSSLDNGSNKPLLNFVLSIKQNLEDEKILQEAKEGCTLFDVSQ